MTDLTQRADRRDDRRHAARSTRTAGGMQALHLLVAVLPAAVIACLAAATVTFVHAAGHSAATTREVLIAAAAVAVIVLIGAAGGAAAATRRLHDHVTALRASSSRGQDDLRLLAEKAQRGERPRIAEPLPVEEGDPFDILACDLQRERHAAQLAVIQTAALQTAAVTPGGGADQRVEVFVNLARRMQSLVHREIELLDDLEGQVEDPVLLKGLFTVDHLATRMRRQSESLAVLGGAVSRRQWSRPVTMQEVLRAAVAEVEQYSRVKVVPPVEGTLQGNAVADVIHLVAELIENATKFSAPHTQALLRAQTVTAGLLVEVEDRGLGMVLADQQRMNGLLIDPGRVNISELLRDGRIGLFVVSTLARRHGIRVQLQSNIYGGIQAVAVLPMSLIEAGPPERERQQVPRPEQAAADESFRAQALAPGAGQAPVPAPAMAPAGAPRSTDVPAASPATARRPVPAAAPGTSPWLTPAADSRYATQSREGAPAAGSAGGQGGPAQAGQPAGQAAGQQSPGQPPLQHAPSVPPVPDLPPGPPDHGERPMLPRRQGRSHLAPQLRDAAVARQDEPVVEQIPGLMAAFQQGVSRAAEEDSPTGTDSTR